MAKGPLPDREELTIIAGKVMEATGAREVFLFGSLARGDARPDSDIDLLYVLPNDADLPRTAARAERALWPREWPMDLIPMRERDWRAQQSALARRVASEGLLIGHAG